MVVHWERELPDLGSIARARGKTLWVLSGMRVSQDAPRVLPPCAGASTKLPCGAGMLLYEVLLEKPTIRHSQADGL